MEIITQVSFAINFLQPILKKFNSKKSPKSGTLNFNFIFFLLQLIFQKLTQDVVNDL